jgi:hypothetical protein
MTETEMEQATAGMKTKSDKIRRLDQMGVSRADIARFLGIRYQHVRNVLIAPAPVRPDKASSIPVIQQATTARPLTIEQAKLGLAAHFGVPADAIEITIRG